MSIIGVLAAVAVPAYQKYKKSAAVGAMGSDAANVGRSILACATLNPFSQCDTAAESGVDNVPGITLGTAKSPKVCFVFSREIAGITYNQCISTDIAVGKFDTTNSEPFCWDQKAGGDCTSDPKVDCTKNTGNLECGSDSDCPLVHAKGAGKCVSTTNGSCDSDGDCT